MNVIKYSFQLLLIISLFITNINSSLIKIPYADKELPISEEYEDFHPFDISLEFIDYEGNENIINKISIIKSIVMRIPYIISELFLCS
jgi:hypothetical protein